MEVEAPFAAIGYPDPMITPAQATDAATIGHWIGGKAVEASGDGVSSVNPFKPGDVVAVVPRGDSKSVARACESALDAFTSWSALAGPARAEFLYRWAEAIKSRGAELAIAMVREVGKPIVEARGEVTRCEMILRYYAGEAVREDGDVIPAQTPGPLQFSLRRPLGVCALITPWNFPLAIPLWKAAPALAMGNTVVLKPAEQSSFVASLLAETSAAAGLPEGVFNVVFGQGSVIGKPLLEHSSVRGVSFTGSDTVGKQVALTCAERNVKFQTEMGGKNVAIVLADADLTQAANLIAGGAMRFAGQKCTATSRAVIEDSVYEPFVIELKKALDKLLLGDPASESTAVGPVISEDSQSKLTEAISRAKEEVVYSSAAPAEGFFIPPTVFGKVDPSSELAQEELFGPVLALIEARDYEHAIALANNTRFGLSASLFTKKLPMALDYVKRIEAGMVRVNADTTGVDPHAPFGGVKGSSSGTREQGPAAKEFFTELRTVQVNP